ncbi:MAG: YggS family pyridoxal phosphate-dependent enzyme, partial [Sphingorhabdus sp.]
MPDATPENPAQRLAQIEGEMAKAAKVAGRASNDITLIAVSKTRSADEITPLLEAGHRQFGENRVQEAAAKWPQLRATYPD